MTRPLADFETRKAEAKRAIREATIDGVQRRSVPATFEIRGKSDGGFTIAGHAAVFHDLSENLGGFREKIDPGAFSKVLSGRPDTRALFNHDSNLVLARTTNGTLRMHEDETGLYYEADVADTSYGRDLRVLLERGDVSQSSFAFRLASGGDSWEEDEDTGGLIRTIHEFSQLYDVSPVTYPAYPTATSGLARNVAVTITGDAKGVAAALRDSDDDEVGAIAQMIALGTQFLDTEEDPDDAAEMDAVIKQLTALLAAEVGESEGASSLDPTERNASADAQEQGKLAVGATERAEDTPTPWRAKARARDLRMRERALRL